jgi:hypothetical protein
MPCKSKKGSNYSTVLFRSRVKKYRVNRGLPVLLIFVNEMPFLRTNALVFTLSNQIKYNVIIVKNQKVGSPIVFCGGLLG